MIASRFLIVLCSKNSAKSAWVNKEIEYFRSIGRGKLILALILDGKPNSTVSGEPGLECFPPALRSPHEPIAGDLRKDGDGRDRGFLKILAGIAQIDFDQLYRRHERVMAKFRITVFASAIALILLLGGLAFYALKQCNDAYIRRAEAEKSRDLALSARLQAENLIDFMTFALRDKLEGLGRLDLMDDVNQAVERYHRMREEDMKNNGDAFSSIEFRRRAVSLVSAGDGRASKGNLPAAIECYREALEMFTRLTQEEPFTAEWQSDLANCQERIGDVLLSQGDCEGALRAFESKLAVFKRLIDLEPLNQLRRRELALSLVRVGDVRHSAGDRDGAQIYYQ